MLLEINATPPSRPFLAWLGMLALAFHLGLAGAVVSSLTRGTPLLPPSLLVAVVGGSLALWTGLLARRCWYFESSSCLVTAWAWPGLARVFPRTYDLSGADGVREIETEHLGIVFLRFSKHRLEIRTPRATIRLRVASQRQCSEHAWGIRKAVGLRQLDRIHRKPASIPLFAHARVFLLAAGCLLVAWSPWLEGLGGTEADSWTALVDGQSVAFDVVYSSYAGLAALLVAKACGAYFGRARVWSILVGIVGVTSLFVAPCFMARSRVADEFESSFETSARVLRVERVVSVAASHPVRWVGAQWVDSEIPLRRDRIVFAVVYDSPEGEREAELQLPGFVDVGSSHRVLASRTRPKLVVSVEDPTRLVGNSASYARWSVLALVLALGSFGVLAYASRRGRN